MKKLVLREINELVGLMSTSFNAEQINIQHQLAKALSVTHEPIDVPSDVFLQHSSQLL